MCWLLLLFFRTRQLAEGPARVITWQTILTIFTPKQNKQTLLRQNWHWQTPPFAGPLMRAGWGGGATESAWSNVTFASRGVATPPNPRLTPHLWGDNRFASVVCQWVSVFSVLCVIVNFSGNQSYCACLTFILKVQNFHTPYGWVLLPRFFQPPVSVVGKGEIDIIWPRGEAKILNYAFVLLFFSTTVLKSVFQFLL